MESRVKLLGHPIHPMLVVFPLGLFTTAVIFDVLYLMTMNPTLSFAGIGLALITGWLGGELVYQLHTEVDSGANVNTSSSLTDQTPIFSSVKRTNQR